ncbi:MAG: PIN domain-containing protein [Candidatus Promineofilum sp.]|jgi:predicted nucleic acid-binding protein|nr:PIN domain-containing protein [Promineifilum sp.]
MASERRFVFDTNSIVSALLLRQSVSRQAFDHARGQGILLVSLDTLAELSDVLRRPRFARYVTEQEDNQRNKRQTQSSELGVLCDFA